MRREEGHGLATARDVLRTLRQLDDLPRYKTACFVETSEAEHRQLWRRVFAIALDGVAVVDLEMAVAWVLGGALGHGEHPTPPELRLLCNDAAEFRTRGAVGRTRH